MFKWPGNRARCQFICIKSDHISLQPALAWAHIKQCNCYYRFSAQHKTKVKVTSCKSKQPLRLLYCIDHYMTDWVIFLGAFFSPSNCNHTIIIIECLSGVCARVNTHTHLLQFNYSIIMYDHTCQLYG